MNPGVSKKVSKVVRVSNARAEPVKLAVNRYYLNSYDNMRANGAGGGNGVGPYPWVVGVASQRLPAAPRLNDEGERDGSARALLPAQPLAEHL